MTTEKRGAERFGTQLRVQVLGSQDAAVTRDFSQSGFSFTSTAAYPVGACLDVAVDLPQDGEAARLLCEAEMVRCEAAGALFLVSVRLTASAVFE